MTDPFRQPGDGISEAKKKKAGAGGKKKELAAHTEEKERKTDKKVSASSTHRPPDSPPEGSAVETRDISALISAPGTEIKGAAQHGSVGGTDFKGNTVGRGGNLANSGRPERVVCQHLSGFAFVCSRLVEGDK